MTRIVAISDTHNQHQKVILPEGDILIHAGDLTGRGSDRELFEVFLWLEKQAQKFKHVIFIAGNHDFGLETECLQILSSNIHYLEDEQIELEGIKFYGSPWTPTFFDWAFMKADQDLKEVWDKIPDDTQVLITHGPAYGFLDETQEHLHVGSRTLKARILELSDKKLTHHICGHIHEGYGYGKGFLDGGFYNVSTVNRRYEVINPPVIIDIEV